MAHRRRRTLAEKTGVSQKRLSRKIAKVKQDDPDLTNRQAAGKAHGILKDEAKKR